MSLYTLICANCGTMEDREAGYHNTRRKFCSDECFNEHKNFRQREQYKVNPRLHRNTHLKDKGKRIINQAKDVPCMDCGCSYPPYIMDFDHRDPSQKFFSIGSGALRNPDALKAEIAKCDVVCANCHRERTHGKTPGESVSLPLTGSALKQTKTTLLKEEIIHGTVH